MFMGELKFINNVLLKDILKNIPTTQSTFGIYVEFLEVKAWLWNGLGFFPNLQVKNL